MEAPIVADGFTSEEISDGTGGGQNFSLLRSDDEQQRVNDNINSENGEVAASTVDNDGTQQDANANVKQQLSSTPSHGIVNGHGNEDRKAKVYSNSRIKGEKKAVLQDLKPTSTIDNPLALLMEQSSSETKQPYFHISDFTEPSIEISHGVNMIKPSGIEDVSPFPPSARGVRNTPSSTRNSKWIPEQPFMNEDGSSRIEDTHEQHKGGTTWEDASKIPYENPYGASFRNTNTVNGTTHGIAHSPNDLHIFDSSSNTTMLCGDSLESDEVRSRNQFNNETKTTANLTQHTSTYSISIPEWKRYEEGNGGSALSFLPINLDVILYHVRVSRRKHSSSISQPTNATMNNSTIVPKKKHTVLNLYRSFSDFQSLYSAMKKHYTQYYPHLLHTIPTPPQKEWLWKDHSSPSFLENRRMQLERWLSALCLLEYAEDCPRYRLFMKPTSES
eukprot:CFRG2601T1